MRDPDQDIAVYFVGFWRSIWVALFLSDALLQGVDVVRRKPMLLRAVVGLLLFAAIIQVSPDAKAEPVLQLSESDWPMLMHDPSHSGYTHESIAPEQLTGRLNVKWKVGLGERVEIEAQPIVAYGKVYIGVMNGKFHAIDVVSGQIDWTFQAGGAIPHTAAAANGKVYFGCEDARVYALDASTGELVWSLQTGGPTISAPTVVNNVLYIGSFDTYLYALGAETGDLQWRYKTEGRIWNSPAVVDDRVYFGSEDMHAYCLHATSGTLAWKRQLSGMSMRNTYPVVSNGVTIWTTIKPGVESYMPLEGFELTDGLTPEQVIDLWNDYYQLFPERRYLFYLDASTGEDKWDPIHKKYVPFPLPYWGLIIPLVDDSGFAWFPASGGGGDHALDHNDRLWKINLVNGTIYQAGSQDEYMMQPDETGTHTMGGTTYYQTAQMNVGMFDTTTKQKYHIYGGSSWPSSRLMDPTPTIHRDRYAGAGVSIWEVSASSPLVIADGIGYYTAYSWLYALTSETVAEPGVTDLGIDHSSGPSGTERSYVDLVDELNWRVEQITVSGPLRPQPTFWGWNRANLHPIWLEGEAIAALAQTMPYLRPDVQQRLQAYLEGELVTHVMDTRDVMKCMVYGEDGVIDPCDADDLEGEIRFRWFGGDLNVIAENLYAAWAYAHYTGDWQTISDHWSLLSDRYGQLADSFDDQLGFYVDHNKRWHTPDFKPNLQIAAMQSVYRMAEHEGDVSIRDEAYDMLQRMYQVRLEMGEYVQKLYDEGTFQRAEADAIEAYEILPWQGYRDRDTDTRQVFWTDGTVWEIFSFPTSAGAGDGGIATKGDGNYSDLIGYHPLFAELGEFLREHLRGETEQYVQTVTNLNPWWYWSEATHCMQTSGENLYNLPHLSTAIFQAKAYILREDFHTLQAQLPWEFAAAGVQDIYRLQNLVALLEVGDPGLGPSTKAASYSAPRFGQTVTYTVAIRTGGAPLTETVHLTDTIPAGLAYVPNTLTASQGTRDDSAAPTLRWSGMLSDTTLVTVTYEVTVTETSPRAITNDVIMDAGSAGTYTCSATIIANGYTVPLPLVLRNAHSAMSISASRAVRSDMEADVDRASGATSQPVSTAAQTGRISSSFTLEPDRASPTRRVNAPYFDGEVAFSEAAVFWFGRVTPTENYADVRLGYNDDELYIRLAAFDRRLWRDTTPSLSDLTTWDAATLYLDLDGNTGSTPEANTYRFVGQLNWWRPRDEYQVAYRGDGSGWVSATVPFTTASAWRGNAINDDKDDRGWAITFHIPFASLGLANPPSQGTVLGMALALHDRDDANGTPIGDKTWPEALSPQQPATWGQLAFGLPQYPPPRADGSETVTIRHKLDGMTVTDASVGGNTSCGGDLDYWTMWGETNEAFYNPERSDFNIQNQSDVADWPCFSKYYATFPLDALSAGKVIVSATLTLHQFGGSGDPAQAVPSLIQVLTVAEDWDDAVLTWNNAPLAVENVAVTWVDRAPFPGWPGTPFSWDVSGAVVKAYASGEPLRLALYDADSVYNSGKYFISSNTGDWNASGRPTLRVLWGEPVRLTKDAQAIPVPSDTVLGRGGTITYTLHVLGTGQALTVTDVLPAGISHPLTYTASYGSIAYGSASRRLTWTGAPSTGQAVTITYPVTVTHGGTYAVVNTAYVTAADGSTWTASSTVIVEPRRVFLPRIFRRM